MGKIIGIDFGTTNSCVAIMEGNEAIVIPNSEGSRTTPSVVAFSDSGERLVGFSANRYSVSSPENSVSAVKRLIGKRFDSKEVQSLKTILPYSIVPSQNGDTWVEIQGRKFSPSEISAMIVRNLKKSAEDYLGEAVSDAVITCPAHFDNTQRQATIDACTIAGLNVHRVINEPTAAALAYGTGKESDGLVAVFDMGGGTFDITILDICEGVFEVRATSGDNSLGGEDFDRRVVDFLLDLFMRSHGFNLKTDKIAVRRLKDAAAKARHELSSALETEINLPFICSDRNGPQHLSVNFTRSQLEIITRDLVDRCEEPCRKCMADAGIRPKMVREVILVGGMSRMPRVRQKAREIFGMEPHKGLNPDEVVAMGAAIQGGVLSGNVNNVLLLDITPLSLGVETNFGLFTRIIEKNTHIPVRKSCVFSTSSDNQQFVDIIVLQGERPLASDNRTLGRFQLMNLPPSPRGVPQIEVVFEIDANGVTHVSATDLGTGREQHMRIVASSGLNSGEIRRIIKESECYQEEDSYRKECLELKNNTEGLVYTVQRTIEEFRDSIGSDLMLNVLSAIKMVKDQIAREELGKLKQSYPVLEKAAYRLTEAIYSPGMSRDVINTPHQPLPKEALYVEPRGEDISLPDLAFDRISG